MATVEIILVIVGILMLIGGIIVYVKSSVGGFIFLGLSLMAIGIGAFCIGCARYDNATTTIETNKIFLTIKDKTHNSVMVGVPGKGGHRETRYYFIFDNNEKTKVSKGTYEKYKINDTIRAVETITYRIDRETKEKINVIETTYDIKN